MPDQDVSVRMAVAWLPAVQGCPIDRALIDVVAGAIGPAQATALATAATLAFEDEPAGFVAARDAAAR